MRRLLSVDGGGIRGILPAVVLVALEEQLGKPLASVFDMVAGTSTGGILACGLAAGVPAADLLALYTDRGAEIFSRSLWQKTKSAFGVSGPKYDPAPLEAILKHTLGPVTLSQARCKLLVPSYAIELPKSAVTWAPRGSYFFKSWTGADWYMRDAARATSAAPTYFPPHECENFDGETGAFIDGGVFAVSPGQCAAADARKLWPHEPLTIISLGTGEWEPALPYTQMKNAGLVDWAKCLTSIFMDGQSDAVDYELAAAPDVTYLRLDLPVRPASNAMDDASPENIAALIARGRLLVTQPDFACAVTWCRL